MFHYYLRGVLGNARLIEGHQEAIDRILLGDYTNKNIEKLRGHDVYSLRLGDAERLLFTTIGIDGRDYLLVLDYLPTHDYHKSKFLRSGVLSRYKEKVTPASAMAEEQGFERVEPGHLAERFRGFQPEALPERRSEALDYYREKWIVLNAIQNEALSIALPAVISGAAGSGKSCVALSLLSTYASTLIEDEAGPERRLLYVTKSARLVESMRKAWRDLPIAQASGVAVEFKTYEECLLERLPQGTRLADAGAFEHWYKDHVTHEQKIAKSKGARYVAIDAEVLFEEFRICSGFNEKDYLQLGEHQSLIEKSRRAEVFAALKAYQEAVIDANFCVVEEGFELYDLVVVDETQDLSHAQIQHLASLARERRIAFFMDNHQRLYDRRSVRPYLFDVLNIDDSHHVRLKSTYRCPPKVIAAANDVLQLKHQLVQGLGDKQDITQVESQLEKMSSLGAVHVIDEDSLIQSDWLKRCAKGAQLAIVTAPEHVERARAVLNTPLVFTPDQIKGLEYDVVLAWNLYDADVFKAMRARFQEVKDKKQPSHRAKAGDADERFIPYLNQLFTSYTRAQLRLIICEKAHRDVEPLLEKLRRHHQALPGATEEVLQSPPDAWEDEMEKQVLEGHVALAKRIFTMKLGGTEEAFDNLLEARLEARKKAAEPQPAKASSIPQVDVLAASAAAAVVSRQPKDDKGLPKPSPETERKAKKKAKEEKPATTTPPVVAVVAEKNEAKSLEQRFAENLHTKFDERRLLNMLKREINLEAFLRGSSLNDNGKLISLLDFIQQDEERTNAFMRCLVNDTSLFNSELLVNIVTCTKGEGLFKKRCADFLRLRREYLALSSRERELFEYSPIHVVSKKGNIPLLKQLIGLGADLNRALSNGATPAFIAAEMGYEGVIRVLGEFGADLNQAMSNGVTPAYIAAQMGREGVIRALGEFGANFNQAMSNSVTPAYIAAQVGHEGVIRALGEFDANLNQAVNGGATPAYIAAQRGHEIGRASCRERV